MKNCFFLFSLCFLFCVQSSLAQNYTDANTASKKAKRAFEEGLKYSRTGNYNKAITSYTDALAESNDFIDAHLMLGGAYAELKNFVAAEAAFEAAIRLDPTYKPIVFISVAETEWQQDKFQECAEHAETFLRTEGLNNPTLQNEASVLAQNARFSIKAHANPVPFHPKPLAGKINSPNDEYLPCLTADGKTLIYTRLDRGDENFYMSQLQSDSTWSEGYYMKEINTQYNEGAEHISPDGTVIVYTACDRARTDRDFVGGCDIYFTLKQGENTWSTPRPFAPPINHKGLDRQPCLSADGQELFFSSNRSGGLGSDDLWVTKRGSDGKWGQPMNLGDSINTPLREQTPFLHPDGKTLYFTSDGHPGLGQNDIYLSRRQADGTWGKAENLGYPINTKSHEGTLTVSLDGKIAFYAAKSELSQGGSLDLFNFELPDAARANPVTFVRVRVSDKNKNPLRAVLTYTLLTSGENFAKVRSDKDGENLVCLPVGQEYGLNVSLDGYTFYSENFNFAETRLAVKPYELEITLEKLDEVAKTTAPTNTVKYTLSLKNILFPTGSSVLQTGSTAELTSLLEMLNNSPSQRIIIEGHTDNVGEESENQVLSEARAKAVYQYLIDKGIDANRLQYKGKGENEAVASNDTADGRAANRRTVILFL